MSPAQSGKEVVDYQKKAVASVDSEGHQIQKDRRRLS
jgi:hypothetical protein